MLDERTNTIGAKVVAKRFPVVGPIFVSYFFVVVQWTSKTYSVFTSTRAER